MDINIGDLLQKLALLSMIITIVTENTNSLVKPFYDMSKYKLIIAFLWTSAGVIGLNVGMMELLGMIGETAMPWIHEFDLAITVAFFTTGAQTVHRLIEMFTNYIGNKTQS